MTMYMIHVLRYVAAVIEADAWLSASEAYRDIDLDEPHREAMAYAEEAYRLAQIAVDMAYDGIVAGPQSSPHSIAPALASYVAA